MSKEAKNTIFLVRSTDSGLEVVETFSPSEESKTPKRALKAFLASVFENKDHALHEDLVEDRLEWISGRLAPASAKPKTEISL